MDKYKDLSVSKKKYIVTRILLESGFFQLSEITLENRVVVMKRTEHQEFMKRFEILTSRKDDFEDALLQYIKVKKSTVTLLLQKIRQSRLKIEEYIDTYQSDASFCLEDELKLLEN